VTAVPQPQDGWPDFLAAAHAYLDRGFQPIPWDIRNGRKKVSLKGFHYRDYSVTHADIDRRFAGGRMVGLAMSVRSRHFALDFDPVDPATAQARIDRFCAEHQVPPTACQITSRGIHLVYRDMQTTDWPRDGKWSKDWMDVEVRSNGFIAAAPSFHPSGHQYRWLDDRRPASPGPLLSLRPAREPRTLPRGNPRPGGPAEDLDQYERQGIPVGWQDTELHRMACRYVRVMEPAELCSRLWDCLAASLQDMRNPWTPENVVDKVRRAAEFISEADRETLVTARSRGWTP
jgi:hypothetical protein